MRTHPINFREEEVKYVTKRWRANESVSLVGVGSVGKTNLLHHLCSDKVLEAYRVSAAGTDHFQIVVIDPNLLGPLPHPGAENAEQYRCWAGYEMMMRRLYLEIFPQDTLGTGKQEFFQRYEDFQDGSHPMFTYLGLRHLELALDSLLKRGMRIVFVFDEFEELLKQMPIRFFLNLRGLRDAHKSALTYLTFSRAPLPVLTKREKIDPLLIEPFIELFTDNLYFVGPYNKRDAEAMLDRLINRNDMKDSFPKELRKFLLEASGRFAGILRAAFRQVEPVLDRRWDFNEAELTRRIAQEDPGRSECETIWRSLTVPEQLFLKMLASVGEKTAAENFDRYTRDQTIKMLVLKRLLHFDQHRDDLYIEPPVFREFILTNPAINSED